MIVRTPALLAGILAVTLVGANLAAHTHTHTHGRLLAEHGPRTCATDANCSGTRVPPPRVCPHGGTTVATACCRMGYCGICWSDCPPATGP